MVSFKFECGMFVKDKLTGITGPITVRAEYIAGCRRYLVEVKENDTLAEYWFDEERLTAMKKKAIDLDAKPTGGAGPSPRISTPR